MNDQGSTRYWVSPAPPSRLHSNAAQVREFHRKLPGYRPTPLVSPHDLAERIGVGAVHVKYERERFGLPAFKALGASWAVYRWLHHHTAGGLDQRWNTFDELRALVSATHDLTLVTATDGNHGRAVAYVARLFGFKAMILVPEGTARQRIYAIEGEGAVVTVVSGDYDHAVAAAAVLADDNHIVVSDTSWAGYVDIPTWIAQGYSTLFQEIDEEIRRGHRPTPELVIIPVGVGALAQAALDHYADRSTKVIAVEPLDAACLLASLEHDRVVSVPGPHRSMMAGLNCGTPSRVAWPVMRDGFSAALAIDDRYTLQAMRLLADFGVAVGETGGAGLAALLAMMTPGQATLREAIGVTPDSTVLVVATESVTDPDNYARVMSDGHFDRDTTARP